MTSKIHDLLGLSDKVVLASGSRGVNAFPWTYRQYCLMVNLLPILNPPGWKAPDKPKRTEEARRRVVADHLSNVRVTAGQQVILLVLCPLTPLVDLMEMYERYTGRSFADEIQEIVWMGGSLAPSGWRPGDAPFGNVDTGIAPGANPNAEWNAYWDPYAVDKILRSGIPLKMFPLNVTNLVPFGPDFIVDRLDPDAATYPMYDLAAQMYSTVAFEGGYSFWDTLTTSYLGKPGLFTLETKNLSIDTDSTSADFGTISEDPSGNPVQVATSTTERLRAFYDYYLGQLRTVKVV